MVGSTAWRHPLICQAPGTLVGIDSATELVVTYTVRARVPDALRLRAIPTRN